MRRTELTLWALGVILLGSAFADTAARWSYQAQQERALLSASRPDSNDAGETPRRSDSGSAPIDLSGPVPAANTVPTIPKWEIVELKEEETKSPKEVQLPADFFGQPKPKPKKARTTPVEASKDLDAFGRIEIPRIGVRAVIRKGDDEETLDRAVGLLPGAAIPGEAGNVVLAAHRDTFFRPLRKIRVADRIKILVPPNEYVYEVESTRVVSPTETSVLQSRGVDELTLVTCYPFGFVGTAPDRFIVSAKRVD